MKYSTTAFAIAACLVSLTLLSEEQPEQPGKNIQAVDRESAPPVPRPSLQEARRQAGSLHTAIHATLQAVHHRYYREDEGLPIPAAVLKDVFAELEQEEHVKLRWLAVEGQVMNSDHKPRDSFEEDSAKALKAGEREFERVEDGVYRRAGPITLTNQCLKCHVPDRKNTKNRTAGLIVSIAIKKE